MSREDRGTVSVSMTTAVAPRWVDEGPHTLVPTLHALQVIWETGSGPANDGWPRERAWVSPLPQGPGQSSQRCWRAKGRLSGVFRCLHSGPVKLGPEKGLCSAEARPASPWGKGWIAAVSSPTPPTTPRGAFSGVLPSQASFPKMQGHLLRAADLRPQLSHLVQQKLHLLGLLGQQNGQVPARPESRSCQRAAHPLWGASKLSKEQRHVCFPCFVSACLPHQVEQKAKAGGKDGSPGCWENECR